MTKIVLAFGSFDIVHPGHLSYLEAAKRLGDRLVVIVARDSSIRRFKRREPAFSERERVRLIGALKPVDLAVLGNRVRGKEDMFVVLKKYNPAVVALGYDQKVGVADIERRLTRFGIEAKVVRIGLKPEERSRKSSRLRRFV